MRDNGNGSDRVRWENSRKVCLLSSTTNWSKRNEQTYVHTCMSMHIRINVYMHRSAHTHAHTQQMNENEQATTTTPQFQPLCAPRRPMRMRNRRVRLLPFSYATKTTTSAAAAAIRSSPDLRRMKGQTPKRKNYNFAHTLIL